MPTAVKDAVARCERKIRKPVRYCQITVPLGPVQLDGKVVRSREKMRACAKKGAKEVLTKRREH